MKKIAIIFAMVSCMVFSKQSDKIDKSSSSPNQKNKMEEMQTPCGERVCQQAPIDTKCCCPCCPLGISFAFKPCYFWPQDKVFRRIYDGGYLSLLEMSYNVWRCLGIWLEIGYFFKETHVRSVDIVSPTEITQMPLSIGISYTFKPTCWLDLYLKIGPNWVYTKTWLEIPGLRHTVVKNTFGGTFGGGMKFDLTCGWFLEIFANYLFDRREVHDKNSHDNFHRYLGGVQTGGGIGYRF